MSDHPDDGDPPFLPPDARMIPVRRPAERAAEDGSVRGHVRSAGAHRAWEAPPPPSSSPDVAVRPFVITRGRTRPAGDDLRVETLLQAVPGAATAFLRFELREIVEVCAEPTSLAEVAARLAVPLGVARVLVDDLVTMGPLAVIRSARPSIHLIERVRDRVRAL